MKKSANTARQEHESKQKISDPEASSDKIMGVPHNPIQGNFIPLSKPKPKSRSSKERSSTDGPEEGSRNVYLKLSLTDSQMEKLAAVYVLFAPPTRDLYVC